MHITMWNTNMESVVESKDLLYWVLDQLNEIKKLSPEQIPVDFSKSIAALDTVKGTFQKDTTVNKYLRDATDHIQKIKEDRKHIDGAWEKIGDTISYLDKNYNYIINNIPDKVSVSSGIVKGTVKDPMMLSLEERDSLSRKKYKAFLEKELNLKLPENLTSYEKLEFKFDDCAGKLKEYFDEMCSWKSLSTEQYRLIDRIWKINTVKDLSRLNQFILDNIVPNIVNLIWNKDNIVSDNQKQLITRFLGKIWYIWKFTSYNKIGQDYVVNIHPQAYVPQQPGNFKPGVEIPAKTLMEGIMLMDFQQLPEITPDNLRDPYIVYGVNEWLYEWYAFDPDEWSVVSVTKTKDLQGNDIYTRLKKENGWTESATYVYSRTRDQNWRSIWTKTRLDS